VKDLVAVCKATSRGRRHKHAFLVHMPTLGEVDILPWKRCTLLIELSHNLHLHEDVVLLERRWARRPRCWSMTASTARARGFMVVLPGRNGLAAFGMDAIHALGFAGGFEKLLGLP
jgi:hypothetical protein